MMMQQARTKPLPRPFGLPHNLRYTVRAGLMAALIALDFAMIAIGFRLAYALRFEVGLSLFFQHEVAPLGFYQHLVFWLIPFWVGIFSLFGLYDFKNLFSGMSEYAQVFNACTLGAMTVIIFTFFDPGIEIARAWLVLSWGLISFNVVAGRFAYRRIIHLARSKGRFMSRVLIIGANEEGQAIAQQLKGNPKAGVNIVGFADDQLRHRDSVAGLPVIGNVDSIMALLEKHNVQEIIIASTAIPRKQLLNLFQQLDAVDVPVRLSSGLYEIITTGLEVHDVGNVPLLSVNKVRLTGADLVLKRILDILGAIAALILFLPLMLVIAIAIKLDSPGPIFYRRRVIGVGGKPFDAFKFRSMCTDADERLSRDPKLHRQFHVNYKLKDDPRVTRVGQFIRDKSLDELPQLFNVLLGQMSLVGPRMITAPERTRYGKWGFNLGTVKPGMTGLWQVSGRSDVGYEERVRLDMHYIRNYSIWFDMYLLWLTIPAVLGKRGAY